MTTHVYVVMEVNILEGYAIPVRVFSEKDAADSYCVLVAPTKAVSNNAEFYVDCVKFNNSF